MFRRRAFINHTAQRVPRAKTSGVLRQDWEHLDHGCCVSNPYLSESSNLFWVKLSALPLMGWSRPAKVYIRFPLGSSPHSAPAVYHGG